MLFCVVSIKHFTRECFLDDECKPLNQSAIPILFCVNNAKMKSRRLPTLRPTPPLKGSDGMTCLPPISQLHSEAAVKRSSWLFGIYKYSLHESGTYKYMSGPNSETQPVY